MRPAPRAFSRILAPSLAALTTLAPGCAHNPAPVPAPDPLVRQALNPQTSAEALRTLAGNPDKYVRMAVALNAKVPPALLAELAQDRDHGVVLTVAKHPSTPAATIVALAARGHPGLRAEVARNPGAPVSLLAELADDPDHYTRAILALNPRTPSATLAKLADGDIDVKLQVAANPNTPRRTLYALAGETDRLVVASVCANPSTPPDALAKARCARPDARSEPTSVPPGQMWGPWEHTTVGSPAAEDATAAWRSLRIVGREYALSAALAHGSRGVECLMSYHPVEPVPDSPTLVLVVDEDVPLTRVKVFANMSEARAECRGAVETRAGLNAVPVRVATSATPEQSRDPRQQPTP